ncbi:hypothetical protein BH10PSE13_BH10PSE13_02800 [soil metagenome]
MTELIRFQQLRPATALSDEQVRALGLSLYPDENLSSFARALIAEPDRDSYRALIARYLKAEGEGVLQGPDDLNPVIRAFADWIDFKAKPIASADLADFAATIDPSDLSDLEREWRRIADNFLAAVDLDLVAARYRMDYQLLIRVCHLIARCFKSRDGAFAPRSDADDPLIAAVLDRPILLPAGLALSAHRYNPDKPEPMKMPRPARKGDGRPGTKPDCECHCDEECREPESHCIRFQPYVGDLYLIRETLARYEAGDIADIENVLAGEAKLRKHRTLSSAENSLTTETETTASSERDNSITEKSNLQSEVKTTADQKIHFDAGVTSTLKYGESITITPHANVTGDWAKSESRNIARTYSRDLVSRAVTKLEEKSKQQQVAKTLREVEEHNRHSIKNDDVGAQHRAGLYFWVNRISHAQVMNYGRHLMFDLILPEPAATWRELYSRKMDKDKKAKAPQKPDLKLSAIQPATYGDLLNLYGIAETDGLEPPDPQVAVEMAFSANLAKPEGGTTLGFSSHDYRSPELPDFYEATSASYSIRCSAGHPKSTDPRDQVAVSVSIAGYKVFDEYAYEWKADGSDINQANQEWATPIGSYIALSNVRGAITVAVAGYSTLPLALSGSVTIQAVPSSELMERWRLAIFNAIMADYRRKLEAYESAQDGDATLFSIKGRNPFLNREIERNEVKRHIIAALMCAYFPGMGAIHGKVAPCGYPEIDFAALDRDGPVIRFFEQVFEWEYVTYIFYHSMWARRCKWVELINEDSGDPLFDKFLTAGAARVQVPVRPGMEKIFLWFQATGQLWGASGEPPLPGDAEFVSMIQELKEARQGDYTDRPGLIAATNGSDQLLLTGSSFYWDSLNGMLDAAALAADRDRELLVDFKTYRIVDVTQTVAGDPSQWTIKIERPYEGASAGALKHAVGAVFVGAPWEVLTPTQLVYLRNPTDKLPSYPLA